MTDTVEISEIEGYAWAVPVSDGGEPITDGTVTCDAQLIDIIAGPVVFGTGALVDSQAQGTLAPGALSDGRWRVQTVLTRDGEPQLIDEFTVRVKVRNG